MQVHILGVCGTFMGGIAQIATYLGHTVTGSDQNVYPPMSEQLEQLGINLLEGYSSDNLDPEPDIVIVGNTLSRGNPELEAVLNRGLPYMSGPEWLYKSVLRDKHVLAVSGTHGKTTTTTILTWILDFAGYEPGFLIGGVAENFGISARLTESDYFVIEADEYDTAFSDKRSKFIHYHPRTLIINNLEFDHADIFDDVTAIRREFHHLLRTLPEQARLIYPDDDVQVQQLIDLGCWSEQVTFGNDSADWTIAEADRDFRQFTIRRFGKNCGKVDWQLLGHHNASNALAAIAAAEHVGIDPDTACRALTEFKSVKRRLQCIFDENNIKLYDDFAHHPTAIAATLEALRQHAGDNRIIAIMEPRSNTMKMGVHADTLAGSLANADIVLIYQADSVQWDIKQHMSELGERCQVFTNVNAIVEFIASEHKPHDYIVIMSNGGFEGIHEKLRQCLSK